MIARRVMFRRRPRGDEPKGMCAPAVYSLAGRQCARGWVIRAGVELDAPYYLYWLEDGQFLRRTSGDTLMLHRTDVSSIAALVSRHRDLNHERFSQRPRARRQTLEWLRPAEAVDEYKLEWVTGQSGGSWATFATVPDSGAWSYRVQTPVLADLTWYRFRVTAIKNDNAGTALEWPARYIARIPDPVEYAIAYDSGTGKVSVNSVAV